MKLLRLLGCFGFLTLLCPSWAQTVGDTVPLTARVHTELLPPNFNEFPKHVSDHLPGTGRVGVVADDD